MIPTHTSHSSVNSWLRCGKAYELEKIRKVPRAPAYWLLGGSAVHKATEWIDKGEWDDAPEAAFHYAFYLECKEAKETWPDDSTWLKAGYGARAQGFEHWSQQGPRYVKQWADRGERWDYVELDVSTTLPSGIEIKAYVDRVHISKKHHQPWMIWDLKTGSTRPDSNQQLGFYKVLTDKFLRENYGPNHYDVLAGNYMFKDDEFYPMDVSNWTLDTVDQIAQEWMRGVESQVFIPNRGALCGRCSVAEACYLQSGDTPTTRTYDILNPHYNDNRKETDD